MIPRLKPCLGWEEFLALIMPSRKNEVERFEKSFAELAGQKYAVAFPYGRTALIILLKAMGFKNSEVICPAYTCVVVPHAIVYSGNKPVFVDSQEYDFNMDLTRVPEAINEKTAALIPTSVFGYPVNLDQLDRIREKYPGLFIIQDCCHSFFAEWKCKPVHKAGDAALFSFNISKMITSIFGGMVTTDRDDVYERLVETYEESLNKPTWKKALMRRLYLTAVYPAFTEIGYGFVNLLERKGVLGGLVDYYDEAKIDMPEDYLVGITKVEAKVGQAQAQRYYKIVENRRESARYYDEHLKDIPGLKLPPLVEGATYSHYVPRVSNRKAIMGQALKRGAQLGQIIEYCVPVMEAYKDRLVSSCDYPVSSRMAQETINLPIWVDKKIAKQIGKILSDHN